MGQFGQLADLSGCSEVSTRYAIFGSRVGAGTLMLLVPPFSMCFALAIAQALEAHVLDPSTDSGEEGSILTVVSTLVSASTQSLSTSVFFIEVSRYHPTYTRVGGVGTAISMATRF